MPRGPILRAPRNQQVRQFPCLRSTGISTQVDGTRSSSSPATQSLNRIHAILDCGRLEQWRPHGKERRREYICHRRQNAGQVHRNALRCPCARIRLPYVLFALPSLLLSPYRNHLHNPQRPTSYCNVPAPSRRRCARIAKGPRRRTSRRYGCCL